MCQASNWFEAQTKLKSKGNVIKAFDRKENEKNEHLSGCPYGQCNNPVDHRFLF